MNALSKVVQAFRLLPIKEEQAEKALPEAAREGDLATLTRLVEEGVNLEASNYSGITALMKAAALGKLDCLDHLVAKGANLEAQDNVSRRPAAAWRRGEWGRGVGAGSGGEGRAPPLPRPTVAPGTSAGATSHLISPKSLYLPRHLR